MLVLWLLMGLAANAAEVSPPASPAAAMTAEWLRTPTGEDMARNFPLRAQQEGLEGSVVLNCDVVKAGKLANCTASDEDPVGEGFGAAALRLQGFFHMKPMMKDGEPSVGKVRIPIIFRLPVSATAQRIRISHPGSTRHVDVDYRVSPNSGYDNCKVLRGGTDGSLDSLALQVVAKALVPRNVAKGIRVIFPIDFVAPESP